MFLVGWRFRYRMDNKKNQYISKTYQDNNSLAGIGRREGRNRTNISGEDKRRTVNKGYDVIKCVVKREGGARERESEGVI